MESNRIGGWSAARYSLRNIAVGLHHDRTTLTLSAGDAERQRGYATNPSLYARAVTEVNEHLQLLYSRLGIPHCLKCGSMVVPQSAAQIAARLATMPPRTRISLLTPPTGENTAADRLIAELTIPDEENAEFTTRLQDAVERTLHAGRGRLIALAAHYRLTFTDQRMCPRCGIGIPPLMSSHFNANSLIGMCRNCGGGGTRREVDPERIVVDATRSVKDGALRWYGNLRQRREQLDQLAALAAHYGVDITQPWQCLPHEFRDAVLYGCGDERSMADAAASGYGMRPFPGIVAEITRLFHQTNSDSARLLYASYMSEQPCATCHGAGISAAAAAVTLGGKSIAQVRKMTIAQALDWVTHLYHDLSDERLTMVARTLKETRSRLQLLSSLGLRFLAINQLVSPTLFQS